MPRTPSYLPALDATMWETTVASATGPQRSYTVALRSYDGAPPRIIVREHWVERSGHVTTRGLTTLRTADAPGVLAAIQQALERAREM